MYTKDFYCLHFVSRKCVQTKLDVNYFCKQKSTLIFMVMRLKMTHSFMLTCALRPHEYQENIKQVAGVISG